MIINKVVLSGDSVLNMYKLQQCRIEELLYWIESDCTGVSYKEVSERSWMQP